MTNGKRVAIVSGAILLPLLVSLVLIKWHKEKVKQPKAKAEVEAVVKNEPSKESCKDSSGKYYPEGAKIPCGSSVGICKQGTQTCKNGRFDYDCEGSIGPHLETCDGKDNDCDGKVDNLDNFETNRYNCGKCGVSCVDLPGNNFCRNGKCVPEKAVPAPNQENLRSLGTITCIGKGDLRKVDIRGDLISTIKEDHRFYTELDSISLTTDSGDCDNSRDCFKQSFCNKNKYGQWFCQGRYYSTFAIEGVPRGEFGIRVRHESESQAFSIDLRKWDIEGTCQRVGCEDSCRKGEECVLSDGNSYERSNTYCRVGTIN